MVELPKVRVSGRSLTGIAGLNSAGDVDVCFVCCQVEVSATIRFLIQSSSTD